MKYVTLFNLCTVLTIAVLGFQSSNCKNYEEDVVLSLKEKRLLDTFKTRVAGRLTKDYMREDIYLLKWLRSRNFNLEVAETALMDNLKWRKENRIDTIQDEDFSDMKELFKYFLEGRDKLGRSILYFDVGGLDVRRSVVQGQGERMTRYVNKVMDEGCGLVRTLGQKYQNITRGHMIVNMDGYSITQHGCVLCIPFLLRMLLTYEVHYPECVDQVLLLNTPSSVEALLNVARPIMSKDTREALRIYGTNKKVWKEAMSKDFDFSKLPPAIGGTKIYEGMDTHDLL